MFMEGRNKSQASAPPELTSDQDVEYQVLPIASGQDDLQSEISEIENARAAVISMRAQLIGLQKSMMRELRLCRDGPSRPETTIPNPTVIAGSPNHGDIRRSVTWWKRELRLCRDGPSRPETTIPNPTVIAGSPNHGDIRSLPMEWDHTLMMVNQDEARSVFVVVGFIYKRQYSAALFEVKFKQGGEVHMEPQLLEPAAKFPPGHSIQCAGICSLSRLYLLPVDRPKKGFNGKQSKSLWGYIFDTKTRSVVPLNPPQASKPFGTVVSAYGKLYYLASPVCRRQLPDPSFESYDPPNSLWKRLPPFPFYSEYWANGDIVGYAVCHGFILFSIGDYEQYQVMAFHVSTSKWREVTVDNSALFPFRGKGVVVGETIYALSECADEIIAFSFKIDEGDEGVIAYSLSSPLRLQGLEIVGRPFAHEVMRTECLAHLGDHDFCYVQTVEEDTCVGHQYLSLTPFQIVVGEGESHIKTLHSIVCAVDIKESGPFSVSFSFTGECEDSELEEEEVRVTAMKKKAKPDKAKQGKAKKQSSDRKPKTWRI